MNSTEPIISEQLWDGLIILIKLCIVGCFWYGTGSLFTAVTGYIFLVALPLFVFRCMGVVLSSTSLTGIVLLGLGVGLLSDDDCDV